MKYEYNFNTGKLDLVPFSSDVQFIENGNDLELWWKSQKMQTWTYVPPVATPGSPIGILMAITYP